MHFTCPACQRKLSVREDLAGRSVKCRQCGQVVRVPSAPTKTPAAVAPAPGSPPPVPSSAAASCYYCGQAAADPDCSVVLSVSRVGESRVEYPNVPRCRRCADHHQRISRFWRMYLGLGVGGGLVAAIVGAVVTGSWLGPDYLKAISGLAWFGAWMGAVIAAGVEWKRIEHRKPLYDAGVVERSLKALADGRLFAARALWRPTRAVVLGGMLGALTLWAVVALSLADRGWPQGVEICLLVTGSLAVLGSFVLMFGLLLWGLIRFLMRKDAEIRSLQLPWPGGQTCFYCCQREGTHYFNYPFYRVTGSHSPDYKGEHGGAYTVITSYEPASIQVPRCDGCRTVHIRARRSLYLSVSVIFAGLCLILLGVYVSTLVRGTGNPPATDVLLSILAGGSVLGYGFYLMARAEDFRKRGVRSYEYAHVTGFPEYVRLCRMGFQPGKEPRTRAEVTPHGRHV